MCSEWSCVTFCNILFYMALRSDTPPNPQAGKTTPCQLSICAYSIFLKDAYHPYLEVFSSIYMSRKYHALVTRNLFNVADFVLPVCKIWPQLVFLFNSDFHMQLSCGNVSGKNLMTSVVLRIVQSVYRMSSKSHELWIMQINCPFLCIISTNTNFEHTEFSKCNIGSSYPRHIWSS